MEDRELRIGNYIEIDQYPNNRRIVFIESGTDIDAIKRLNPCFVLLTEQILSNIKGFEEHVSTTVGNEDGSNRKNRTFYTSKKIDNYILVCGQQYSIPGEFFRASEEDINPNPIEVWIEIGENDIHSDAHWIFFKHIKYLHQLQNLYFALTGEELEYKPKN